MYSKVDIQKSSKTTHTECGLCKTSKPDKGRAFDGRRAYRCQNCGNVWTEGMQGREKRYSIQRQGYQFKDSKGIGHIS